MIERDDNIKYKVAEELITSLEGYYNLVHLTLLDSSFGGRGSYIAISNILQDPRYKLKDLTLSCFDTDSEVMTILADALVKSRTLEVFAPINCPRVHQVSDILAKASFRISSLRSIDLSNSTFGMPGFRSLATCLEDPASSLQILRLNNCIMNDDEALAVGHAMATNTTLKVLELDSNNSVSLVSWGHILVCLQPSSSLEKLSVNQCNISDEILDILVHALVNNSTLKSLSIRTNYSISANAWRSFSVCLRNNSALEEVDMKNNNFNNGSVTALVSALQYDSVLHSLLMINTVEHGITRRSWQVLLNTLCNKSSIDALYTSNHTLYDIGWLGDEDELHVPEELVSFLELNKNDDKGEVARQKIIQYHFLNGDSNIIEFVDMEMKVSPQALAWVGRNNSGHSLLYRICQSTPSLFDTESKAKATGTKRKHIC